jgi:hypothetical protein
MKKGIHPRLMKMPKMRKLPRAKAGSAARMAAPKRLVAKSDRKYYSEEKDI